MSEEQLIAALYVDADLTTLIVPALHQRGYDCRSAVDSFPRYGDSRRNVQHGALSVRVPLSSAPITLLSIDVRIGFTDSMNHVSAEALFPLWASDDGAHSLHQLHVLW